MLSQKEYLYGKIPALEDEARVLSVSRIGNGLIISNSRRMIILR